MAHVAEYKKKTVQEFVELARQYPIIAAVNMENLPTPQLQKMRAQLRDKSVVLRMTKRRLLKLMLDAAKEFKPGIDKLIEHLNGMPALIFTKDNPFALYKTLQKSKSPAPAKAGQIAPRDIAIPAGPTSFAPGPIIGELGAFGIKTGVEGGKIAVKEEKIVVKEGEIIKQKVAELLTRFSITPMEVGLDLTAAYENGTIFTKNLLHIDEAEYTQNFTNAASWAFNLAIEIGYPSKETIGLLLSKASGDARALALDREMLTSETIGHVLAKAEGQMLGVKTAANLPEATEDTETRTHNEPTESDRHIETAQLPQTVIEQKQNVTKEDIQKADELISQIKSGTLNAPEQKAYEPSAKELVDEVVQQDSAEKKRQDALKVPSAHELLQKKLERERMDKK